MVLLHFAVLAASAALGISAYCPGFAETATGKGFLWKENLIVTPNHVALLPSAVFWIPTKKFKFTFYGARFFQSALRSGYSRSSGRGRDVEIMKTKKMRAEVAPQVTTDCSAPPIGATVEVWDYKPFSFLRCTKHRGKVVKRFRGSLFDIEVPFKVKDGISGSLVLYKGKIVGMITSVPKGKKYVGRVPAITSSEKCKKCNSAVSLPILLRKGKCRD